MPGGLSEVGNVAQNPLDRIAPEVVADQPGLLDRIGKSVVNPSLAFLNDQSLSEFERDKAESVLLDTRIEGERQSNEAARIAAEEQQQMQELSRIAFGDGPDADDALKEIFFRNPLFGKQKKDGIGANTTAQHESAARDAFIIRSLPHDLRDAALLKRAVEIESQGGNAAQTRSLIGLPEEVLTNQLRVIEFSPLTAAQRVVASGSGRTSAEQAAFEETIKDFSPEDKIIARRIRAGLDPRAVGSSSLTIAEKEGATEDVAGSESIIGGAVRGAQTTAEIEAKLQLAVETATAAAEQAALVTRAQEGEKIKASQVRNAVDAQLLLPDSEAGAAEMIKLLNDVRNDPMLPNVLGAVEGRIDFRLDSKEAELIAKIKQISGKTFLEAYQSLKGGGPITDVEGRAATEAQSRLATRTVELEDYQGAIDELIATTNSRINRLRKKSIAPSSAIVVDGFTIEEVPQ